MVLAQCTACLEVNYSAQRALLKYTILCSNKQRLAFHAFAAFLGLIEKLNEKFAVLQMALVRREKYKMKWL